MHLPRLTTRRWMPALRQVSVRGLMIWVAIVGTGSGWIVHRARMRQHLVDAIVRSGGQVYYSKRDWATRLGWTRSPNGPSQGASFCWLYDGCFREVAGLWLRGTPGRSARLEALTTFTRLSILYAPDFELTDAELRALSNLRGLRDLDIHQTLIDDAGLAQLAGLGQLRSLNLAGSNITDAGLVQLRGLGRLAKLDLSETGVTDAGLIHLAKLPALMSLTLHSTAVSSKGLRALGAIPSLRWLEIHSESVSDEEIAELRRAFPSLQINSNPLW
jgi:hypothetical protein